MKKLSLKILPYFISLTFGLILFTISINSDDNLKSLLINISSAFIAIPLLYLIYDLVHQASRKKLNKEVFEYAKMQIDRELINISHQFVKLIYPYDKQNKSFDGITKLLNLGKDEIANEFISNTYLGFQVLKNWYVSETKIQNMLDSSFILSKLDDDQIIAIINVLKNVRSVQDIYRNIDELFLMSDTKIKGFKVQSGSQLSEQNSEYPDRYLLLRELDKEQHQVFDFGDFEQFKLSKLLLECNLNPKYINLLSESIFETLKSINNWLEYTGSEFLIDMRMYKFRKVN